MLTIVPRFDCQDLRLIEAARSGDSYKIRRLLEQGADPDEADANGITALIVASSVGELKAVKILLSAGADTTKKITWAGTRIMPLCSTEISAELRWSRMIR